jgi:type II secretory pathway pseudopilin PulG
MNVRFNSSWKAARHSNRAIWRCLAFTLIELVISAALMTIILMGAYLSLTSGVSSQKLIGARADIAQRARVALGMMAADLRAASPLHKDFPIVGMSGTLGETEADNLDFATHNYIPRRQGEGDWCEASYFVGKSQDSDGFSLWRRRDPGIDEDPFGGGTREEIIEGLRGLRFEFYDGWEWFDDWGDPDGRLKKQFTATERPNLFGMPEAIRITIWLDSGKSSAASETSETEPAMMFQTVCRLNLAGVSSSAGLTGSANTSGDRPAQAESQQTPEGTQ